MALVAWTLAMLVWMLALRLSAMRKAGVDMGKLVGTRGADADKVLPAQAQWKAHNYNHLHEQPTLFYAVALTLALLGQGDG
ncbi:MAPEG family protein, partial [Escherichia coli]|uniref:MAPEG family protein n=1 Tax=Escherichia coli TaxID=562 RepID=UPI0039DF8200